MFRLRVVDSDPADYTGESYADPAECAAQSRILNQSARDHGSPVRYKVERVQDSEDESKIWRTRELTRFTSGEYIVTPWQSESFYTESDFVNLHFVHMSNKRAGKIAFTESEDKGTADRQTIISAGRYLNKYFGDKLESYEIAAFAADCGDSSEGYEIARTADEIQQVYEDGPHSCMAHPTSKFNSRVHPVRVYGDSDISLAWIPNSDGDPAARVLIWQEKQIRSTVYGDGGHYQNKLESLLDSEGYTDGSCFEGAKIRRIEDGGRLVLPYFDNNEGVSYHDSEYVEITDCCEYRAKSEYGISEDEYTCEGCHAGLSEDEYFSTEYGDGIYCESCYYERFARCEECESEVSTDETQRVEDSRGHDMTVCDSCAADYPECEDCYERKHLDNTVTLNPDCETVCHDCFERNHGTCEDCGDPFHNANLVDHHGDSLCGDCQDARPDDCEDCGRSEDECECESEDGTTAGTRDPSPRNPFAIPNRPQDPRAAIGDLFTTTAESILKIA